MEKKEGANVRNKENSKQLLLNAVGKILRTKGYAALKVNDIAATAGLDKKLIYKYFGNTEGLLDEYIRSLDFWSNVGFEELPEEITDGGQEFSKKILLKQFDYMARNKELQKIILWRLSEERKSLKKLTSEQEKNGEALFKNLVDPFFGDKSENYRAITAILVSGIYYLNLYAAVNGSTFCGIDLKTKKGRAKIEEALSFLIDQSYLQLK